MILNQVAGAIGESPVRCLLSSFRVERLLQDESCQMWRYGDLTKHKEIIIKKV